MKTADLEKQLGYTPMTRYDGTAEITSGYTSDLLSDVMAGAEENSVLITIQGHKNTVAVATLAGITAIVLCSSRPVPDDMRKAAETEDIGIFSTPKNQFEVSNEIGALLAQRK